MEEKLMYAKVQGQIGHTFRNRDLLRQAFVRKSYATENGGADNEVLEFVGDKVLDITVIRYLTDSFGSVSPEGYHEFCSEYSEGKLTQMKARMVQKETLARRIDELGFAEFLIMGKGDILNNVSEEKSVKEDLFEAILGAVAIDSEWNFDKLQSVMELMLDPDSLVCKENENYVQLIQDWEERKNGVIPLFKYYDRSYSTNWYIPFQGVRQQIGFSENIYALKYTCELKLLDSLPIFQAYGKSKSEARRNVCELAYKWLDEKDLLFSIQDEVDNPNIQEAINQLEILARRGYFSIPIYEFKEEYDENGNPIWTAECYIEEIDCYFDAISSSKKDAKKHAAYNMLMYVLGYDEEDE